MPDYYTYIKSTGRIQNQRRYKQYAAHRKVMNDDLKEETEKKLFHVSSE